VLTAGVVQHFQHRGAPGHLIILSGTTINFVNRHEGDEMKKGEMGWACSKNESEEKCIQDFDG